MYSKLKRFYGIFLFFIKLLCAYFIAFILKMFNPKLKNIWIISERGDDARDNGYFFYKFLRTNKEEINAWYIIKSTSADFDKIKKYGQWIEYESFKHYVFYALSTVRISSSAWGGDLPKADYFYKLRKFINKKKKVVFLQHGIIKDYMPLLMAENSRIDLFICGAQPEYEYIKNTFHYPQNSICYTGLARFDNLHNTDTKNQILVMPTFRRWLQDNSENEVRQSEYASRWNALLNDEELIKLLTQHGISLLFYPHYVMQKYVDIFKSSNPIIKTAKFSDYDVQQLLMESKLLITDFSSVFFDFGYMDKPVIYYQFDRERYVSGHYNYKRGYFDYDDMGFGKVVFNHNELINLIKQSVENGFHLDDFYRERVNGFFIKKDRLNCERIYQQINRILEDSK